MNHNETNGASIHLGMRSTVGRHLLPFFAGLLFFFGMNLIPVFVQGQPDSLGNNSDSIHHYLKILRLRGDLGPDWALDLDPRLPTDQRLYLLVSRLSDASGLSLARTLQIIWALYSLFYVMGNYLLGVEVARSPWAGAFMAASGWGFALSVGGHWGWDFSPIVPHDLATAFVPWLIMIWLRIRTMRGFALYLACLGMLAQLYPVTFIHLAFLMVAAQLVVNPRDLKSPFVGLVVFGLAISPLALAWMGRPSLTDEILPLFQKRYYYLAPGSLAKIVRESKGFPLQLLLAGVAALCLRNTKAPEGWSKIRSIGWASLLAGLIGQWAIHVPLLAPLFISRASRFSYIWILLLQGRVIGLDRNSLHKWLGIGICILSLGLRPNLAGPVRDIALGGEPHTSLERYHLQDTNEFRDLCEWVRVHVDSNAVVLTPPDSRYLFLRAYSRRRVLALEKYLGAVHTPSEGLLKLWDLCEEAKNAYDSQDRDLLEEIAVRHTCEAIVYPPEWIPDARIDFLNSAGAITLRQTSLDPGVSHARPPEYDGSTPDSRFVEQ